MAKRLGKLVANRSALFLCDMQEVFKGYSQYFNEIVVVQKKLLQAAKLLEIPIICTEQVPKALGRTVPELEIDQYNIKKFEKTQFSMAIPEVISTMKQDYSDVKSIILCGIEAHVCVQQTALSLLENNFDVHLIADATSSRTMFDRKFGFERMRQSGVFVTTCESIIFSLLCNANHPEFKNILEIVRTSSPEQGLMSGLGDR